jgi:hypothetical protein
MNRKSLYLAASAVALLTTAQAQAANISGTGAVFGTVKTDTPATAFKLAKELTYYTSASSSATATQAVATFDLKPTTSFTVGQSLLLTVDLAGAVFSTSTGFAATSSGVCEVQSIASVTPIAANATSAQYLVNLTGTCTSDGISISAPIQATGAANVVIGAQLQQSFGGSLINVDGGRSAATFVNVTPAFSAAVSATTASVVAQVTNGYRTLNASPVAAGTVTVAVDATVHTALDAAATAKNADIAGTKLTATAVTGSFTGYNLANGADTFATGTSSATVSTVRVSTAAVGPNTINIVDNTATGTAAGINADGIIPASTFTLTAAVDLVDGLTDFSASGALAPVTRDGTSFKAPWIALGAASATSTIRLANNGSTDTGPIQMTLTSTNGDPATNKTVTITAAQVAAGTLNTSGGIPAGGTVSISGAALKTAFGTTAANGDVEVTIEAQPQFISGKVRVQQATGQIFETSLGNLNGVS